VQPLYVPATNFVFNLGLRLGGPSRSWLHTDTDAMVAALRDEGLPFIAPPQSPEDFTRWSAAHDRPDEYSREALAYSLVAAGRFAEALERLDRLATLRADAIDWQRVIAQRASRLATLCRGETDAAQALLRGWESQTAAALGIEDIA
jgi:hypothetical protein